MIVVDANVLLATVLPTASSDQAADLMERDPEWHAPILWQSEVRNALVGLVRQKGLPLEEAVAAYERADRLLREREHLLATARVLELALVSGCTAYDCEYVALAEALGVQLFTWDRQLLGAFPTMCREP